MVGELHFDQFFYGSEGVYAVGVLAGHWRPAQRASVRNYERVLDAFEAKDVVAAGRRGQQHQRTAHRTRQLLLVRGQKRSEL